MTRSQSYAFERSKVRNKPIVLFDEAEVALFMNDLTLFPILGSPVVNGWNLVRSIVFTKFNIVATEAEVLSLVTDPSVDYGFALVTNSRGGISLGVFERVEEQPTRFDASTATAGAVRGKTDRWPPFYEPRQQVDRQRS